MNIGYAVTGSFCTLPSIFDSVKQLAKKHNVTPIASENVSTMDTRFIEAQYTLDQLEEITGNKVINSIQRAEPIGPQKLLDILVVAPCTGNTLAKIAHGITDGTVPMAVKAHLRNNLPVVIGISTNDGLSGSAINIGKLLNTKNIFFIPFGQDDCDKKQTSLVADFSQIEQTIELAILGKQLQPILKY